ncbi:hypothetical protein Tco_1541484 [Tanacetum coccineum]
MDLVILLGQKNSLAEYMILFGADNRPPMLDKDLNFLESKKTKSTIQDGRVQCNKYSGDKDKVILVLGIRVMLLALGETKQADRQGLLNATSVKVKDIWLGNAPNLSGQGMQHDPGVPDGQAVQTIILNNASFQTGDLDTYDSDCDDISNAQASHRSPNISNYGSDVISEVPHSKTYLNDMKNQSMHAMQDFEQTSVVDFLDNEIHSDSNITMYCQYLEETQHENVQDTHLQTQLDSMILS